MKYEIVFTAVIRDHEGYTRAMWSATKDMEIDRLSSLIPMLTSIEEVVEEWRRNQAEWLETR